MLPATKTPELCDEGASIAVFWQSSHEGSVLQDHPRGAQFWGNLQGPDGLGNLTLPGSCSACMSQLAPTHSESKPLRMLHVKVEHSILLGIRGAA